jgi:hypothetical protein
MECCCLAGIEAAGKEVWIWCWRFAGLEVDARGRRHGSRAGKCGEAVELRARVDGVQAACEVPMLC